jgi:hypothetical protein
MERSNLFMRRLPYQATAVLALVVACRYARSAPTTYFMPLTLPTVTQDIRNCSDGSAYAPLYPSSDPTLGGVPFQLRSDAKGNNIFYIDTTNQVDSVLHIPVHAYGVTTVYTLINTIGGVGGADVGSVTFKGDSGSSYSVALIEGSNVRDHFFGVFDNATTDPMTTQAVFGVNAPWHAHYDLQAFKLPAYFATNTLDEIIFRAHGDSGGRAFLAGVTVASPVPLPEPGTSLILLVGASGMVSRKRRRSMSS